MRGGYFTVEATFVMTICIWVIMALLYSGLYLHDRIVVRSELSGTLEKSFRDGKKIFTTEGKADVEKTMEKKLFLMQIKKIHFEKGMFTAEGALTYELPISLEKLKNIFMKDKESATITVKRDWLHPSQYKWNYDASKKGEK